MKRVKLLFLCVLHALFFLAFEDIGIAQSKLLKGTVLDESNLPLPGATVKVDGTNVHTTTGPDGKFELSLPSKNDGTFTVQFLGYVDTKVKIGNQTEFNVIMEPDRMALQEAVVSAGYGTMRKSDITGALTSVIVDDVTSRRVTSIDQLLSGRAAGVVVTQGSAAPGGAIKIRIRGTSSLRGDNEPLYVVDGSILQADAMADPLSTYGQNKGNATQEGQNPLSMINPQDIESIEILKDASATAIYGSQGANGVVLITTKQAGKGKMSIKYNGTFTVSTLAKKLELLSLQEYVDFRNALYLANGNTTDKMDMTNLVETDWQERIFQPSFSQVHRLSIMGNNKGTNYYIAGGFSDRNGLVSTTGLDQQDLRVNLKQKLNDYINLTSNTMLSRTVNNMTTGANLNGNASLLYQVLAKGPYEGNYNADGIFDESSVLETPLTWLDNYDDETEEFRVNSVLGIDAKLTKWLTWSNKLTIDYRSSSRLRWYGPGTYQGNLANGQASLAEMRTFTYNVESLLQFNKKFASFHNISGTAGIVFNDKTYKFNGAVGENFANFLLRGSGIAAAQTYYPIVYNANDQQLFSALARLIYSYKDKYVLTATLRADGSSKFYGANKFAYFPSFAGAWRITEEPFMDNVNFVSNLKLRLGWGQVGNQAVAPYQTLPLYNKNSYAQSGNGGIITGYVPGNIANNDLKWETSEQTNIGLDVGLFRDRVNFSVDAYLKNTKDLLQQFAVPSSTGFKNMWLNRGVIQNKGIEATLNATILRFAEFEWNLSANISVNRNKIISLGMEPTQIGALKDVAGYLGSNITSGQSIQAPANAFFEGMPIGVFFGYQTAGIMSQDFYDNQDPSNRLKLNGNEIKPGDIIYVDQNGDNNVTPDDRVIIGDPNPDFTYGFQTGFIYKNLSLDISFNGSFGAQIVNATRARLENLSEANNKFRPAVVNAWTQENQDTYYPKIGYVPMTSNLTDRFIEDASFLRIESISLGYTLNLRKWMKFVQSLTINASVNNLWVFTNYSGYDPEVDSFTNDPNRIGIDLNSYPRSRNFILGVSLTF